MANIYQVCMGNETIPATEQITEKCFEAAETQSNPSVNLVTGGLKYVFGDLSIGQGLYNIGVSHVYNSKLNSAFNSKICGIGNGWKLNLHQCLLLDGVDENNNVTIKYLDELGDIHKFVMFDNANLRFYNVQNAKVVLTVQQTETIISDGVGNKLIFNNDTGMLVHSISCQTDEVVKHYIYENNRLVRVYVNKTLVNGVVKRKIELSYNSQGLLNSIATYSDDAEKLAMLSYQYDSSNNLVKVIRNGLNKSGAICINKDIGEFGYVDGKLSTIYDSETDAMLKVDYYSNGKVNKISNGYVKTSGVQVGQEANGLFNGYSDGTHCGNLNEVFVKKSHLSYAYYTNSDGVINEVITTSDKDISMAYFLDSDGNIVSSFEVKPADITYYSSLEKETQYKSNAFESLSGTEKINGLFPLKFDGELQRNEDELTDSTANLIELGKNCVCFNYSFWLKLNDEYFRPKVKVSCCYGDYTIHREDVYINGKAKGVWQKVSVPLMISTLTSSSEPCLKRLKIFVYEGERTYIPNCEMVEIGFTPVAPSRFVLALQDREFHLNTIPNFEVVSFNENVVSLNGVTDKDFFTADDLIATISNKQRSSYSYQGVQLYDVICNAGTKRISKVKDVVICADSNSYSFADNTPTCIQRMHFQNYRGTIDTEYTHNVQDGYMKINTNASIAITEDGQPLYSSAFQIIDYKGNQLEEQDEYGMGVMYLYDKYGNPTCTKKYYLDSNNSKVVYETHTTSYDSKLEYAVATDDGKFGVDVSYNKHGNVYGVAEKVLSSETNQLEPTGVSANTLYGVFPEKVISTSLNDSQGESIKKSITYQNGYVRTVSDGAVKFGLQLDFINNIRTYTQFKDGKEIVLKQEIVESNFTSDGMCQDSIEKFYIDEGFTANTIVSRQNAYGKLTNMFYGEKQLTVQYQQGNESAYAQKPATIIDGFSGRTETPTYKKLQEQVGWEETLSNGSKHLTVLQADEGFTKYILGADESEEYFSLIEKDSAKILSPRIVSTTYYRDTHANYDNVKTIDAYTRYYTYDNLGRVTNANSSENPQESKIKNTRSYLNNRQNSPISSMSFSGWSGNVNSSQAGQGYVSYDYDAKENVSIFTKSLGWWQNNQQSPSLSVYEKHSYTYDQHDRLISETIERTGEEPKTLAFTYSNSADSKGRLISVVKDGVASNLVYTNGQLTSFGNTTFTYDNYGNRTSETKNGTTTNYTFTRGDLLASISGAANVSYTYNANGVRTQKKINNTTIEYYLDGNKILGEDRSDNIKLRYFYDKDGICGIRYINENNVKNFVFAKDAQGSVWGIFDGDNPDAKPYVEYTYDAWGNCTLHTHNIDGNNIGILNPFRWKGHYYDVESGLYYANNSYYDPEYCQYVDAAPLEAVFDNVDVPQPIDRNGLLCNNVFEFAPNVFAIYLTRDLSVDYTFNIDENLPFFTQAWRDLLKMTSQISKEWKTVPTWAKITAGLVLLVVAAAINYYTAGIGGTAVSIWACLWPALVELTIGVGMAVVSWAINGLITGNYSWQSLENAVADAVFFTGLFAFVSASLNFIRQVCREVIIEAKLEKAILKHLDELTAQGVDDLLRSKGTELSFVSGVYDRRTGKIYLGYNSEPIADSMLAELRAMGARKSCAETRAIAKALADGAKIGDLYLYTYNLRTKDIAYLCRDCTKAFYRRVSVSISESFFAAKFKH